MTGDGAITPTTDAAEDQLTEIFAALANSTRRAMLARLAEGEATVNELAEPFDVSLPAIPKHIKVLEEVGLIKQGRKAQYRPCSIEAAPLQAVADWTEQYRHIWETSFDRMDAYIGELNRQSTSQPTETTKPPPEQTHETRNDND